MSGLRVSVYTALPIPVHNTVTEHENTKWSPITCTLIYSDKEAVLVDTPITINQNNELISWIEKTAPGRKLSYIYITHGHGDHFFGIPQLLQRFPEAVPLATEGTIDHMQQQITEPAWTNMWVGFFPGNQIYTPQQLAKPLGEDKKFVLEGKWSFHAIECGHTDTFASTILWVPSLKLAVCGDVVYGNCHQMLAEANTQEKRDEWLRAVEKVEALKPVYVVPGHKDPYEMDGVWHLATTKQYIRDLDQALKNGAKTPSELYAAMWEKYSERINPAALGWTCNETVF